MFRELFILTPQVVSGPFVRGFPGGKRVRWSSFLRRRLTDLAQCTLASNKETSTTQNLPERFNQRAHCKQCWVGAENASALHVLIRKRIVTIVTPTNDQRQRSPTSRPSDRTVPD